MADAQGTSGRCLSWRDGCRGAADRAAAVPERGRADRRRDDRVRDGDRQARRAVRRASQSAEVGRGLLPGDGSCRPRRRAGECVDGLRPAGHRHATAVARSVGGERSAQGAAAPEARRADRARRNGGLPSSGAARVLRGDPGRAVRQLRQLSRATEHGRRYGAGAQGLVSGLPDWTEVRGRLRDRRAHRQGRRTDRSQQPRQALGVGRREGYERGRVAVAVSTARRRRPPHHG